MQALDVLGTPGRMTMGAIRGLQTGEGIGRALDNLPGGTREDDFDDVLAAAGVEDTGWRRAAGFVGDVVLDPLNVLPVGPAVRAVGKGLNMATDAARAIPVVDELVEGLGQRLVPHYGLDKFTTQVATPAGPTTRSFQDLARLHDSKLSAVREAAGQDALNIFEGLTNDEAFQMGKALDTGTPFSDPRLEGMRTQAKARFEQQFQKELAAGQLAPGSKLEDYMPHILVKDPVVRSMKARALTAKNPYQLRKQMTFEDGVKAGVFEGDARRAMATRLATGDRAIANQEFFQQTAKQFGKSVEEMPEGFRQVSLSADEPLTAALGDVALPNAIADSLEKLVQVRAQPDRVSRLFSGTTALWKGYATRANPGFHVRNGVSNMLQTWMGGLGDSTLGVMNPLEVLSKHARAMRILKDPSQLPGKVGAYKAPEILQALDDYGVVGGAHTSFNEIDDIIQAEIDHAGKGFVGKNLNPIDKRNWWLRKGADIGNKVENTSRLALFLDQLEKGASLEDAALHVRKYLFDYSELTDFERGIRDKALPFYTWLRKNIPLQVDNLVTQPRKVAVFGKAQDAVEDATADAGLTVPSGSLPEALQDFIQLPTTDESERPVFVSPSLPIQDLNKLQPDFQKDVLAGLNPLLRIPLEVGMNKQFFTDRPIYNEQIEGGGLKPANPLVQLTTPFLPDALKSGMDITETDRGVEMPALSDYAMRQFPAVPTMGRVAGALADDPEAGADNIGALDPNLLALLGVPTRSLSPEQQAMVAKLKRDQLKAGVKAQRKQQRRIQPPAAPPVGFSRFTPQAE